MPRQFTKKLTDPYWWLEQLAHMWIGYGAAMLFSSIAHISGTSSSVETAVGLSAAAAVAIIREIVQNVGDDENDVLDSIADAFFTFGGGPLYFAPVWIMF